MNGCTTWGIEVCRSNICPRSSVKEHGFLYGKFEDRRSYMSGHHALLEFHGCTINHGMWYRMEAKVKDLINLISPFNITTCSSTEVPIEQSLTVGPIGSSLEVVSLKKPYYTRLRKPSKYTTTMQYRDKLSSWYKTTSKKGPRDWYKVDPQVHIRPDFRKNRYRCTLFFLHLLRPD